MPVVYVDPVPIRELHTDCPIAPGDGVLLSQVQKSFMVFVKSKKNGCTYTLDANNGMVLMYHPLYSNGDIETNSDAYEYVDWDCLDDDVLIEADRCYNLLKEELV